METDNKTLHSALAAIIPHASTDVTLPALNGVHVVYGVNSLTIEATNRYTVARLTFIASYPSSEVTQDYVLALKDAKALVAFLKPASAREQSYPVSMLLSDDTLTVTRVFDGGMVSYKVDTEEFTFPKLDGIVPESSYNATMRIQINPEHVASFGKSMKALGSQRGVQFQFQGEAKPARVTIPGVPEFVGALMPIRISD